LQKEKIVFDTLGGEVCINNFSSFELKNSEILISLNDVLCGSHKGLTSDSSDIYDKAFLFEPFQEYTKPCLTIDDVKYKPLASFRFENELDIDVISDMCGRRKGHFTSIFEEDQLNHTEQPTTMNERDPYLFASSQERVGFDDFENYFASMLQS